MMRSVPCWMLILVVFLAAPAGVVVAQAPVLDHKGGLNKLGCHVDRKTGQCHCHREVEKPAC
ncbi:MAG: hypothetical protein H6851_08270 [Geminicoccaceae bacterium]|nr:hypothetical protein [Geminicoccaceae bacterium]MCB9943597.1 hypothetical protein [Geminicoccaceae bacterium]